MPDLRPQVVRFEMSNATHVRLRHVQQVLAEENGGQLDDDAFIEALCDSILDGSASAGDGGRARYQVLTTVCAACQQAWQHAGGRELPVGETDREIAECDAQRLGSDQEPGTAAQDVAPKVRRFVTLRDRQRCTVPGCRAARHIDVHHEPENLTLLCSGHHRALHDGLLTMTGSAPDLDVTWKYRVQTDASAPLPHVGQPVEPRCADAEPNAPRLPPPSSPSSAECSDADEGQHQNVGASNAVVVTKTEAAMALAQMGFTKQEARAVVDEAANRLPRNASFEQLVRAALKLTRR